MRSNAWTTKEEYEFLTARIPGFLSHPRNNAVFLAETAVSFLIEFPTRSLGHDRVQMITVRF